MNAKPELGREEPPLVRRLRSMSLPSVLWRAHGGAHDRPMLDLLWREGRRLGNPHRALIDVLIFVLNPRFAPAPDGRGALLEVTRHAPRV